MLSDLPIKAHLGFCLYPDCWKDPKCRGLCRNHYKRMMAKVRAGKLNLDDLAREKRILPAGPRGPKSTYERIHGEPLYPYMQLNYDKKEHV